MRSPLFREAATPLPVRRPYVIAALRPSGILDDPRRAGAAVAATTIVAVAAIAGLTVMSDRQVGPFYASADVMPATKTAAPAAQKPAAQRPEPVVTTALRGPRVGLVRVLDPQAVPAALSETQGRSSAQTIPAPAAKAADASEHAATPAGTAHDPASAAIPVASAGDQIVSQENVPEGASTDFSQPGDTGTAASPASGSDAPAASAPAASSARTVQPGQSTEALVQATTTTWVNLRSGPDNNASVVMPVPAKASIKAQASCKFWCAVEYRGRHGYIYKDFVKRPG